MIRWVGDEPAHRIFFLPRAGRASSRRADLHEMNAGDAVSGATVDSLRRVQDFDSIAERLVALLQALQRDDSVGRRHVANIHLMQVTPPGR